MNANLQTPNAAEDKVSSEQPPVHQPAEALSAEDKKIRDMKIISESIEKHKSLLLKLAK